MPTPFTVVDTGDLYCIFRWDMGLDVGTWVKVCEFKTAAVQVSGQFVGASAVIEGSNDGIMNGGPLTDTSSNALILTSASLKSVGLVGAPLPGFIRPNVVPPDDVPPMGVTQISVILLVRK